MAKGEEQLRKIDAGRARNDTALASRTPRQTGALGVLGAAAESDPNRVGVVFVHGIGTQAACETFLDWSGAVVGVLADWRMDHGFGEDPVLRCDYDLTGARLPILEVEVPEYDGHAAQTWVMTEAWWAATTRSPGLGSMTAYVRRALPGIIAGIRQSYQQRSDLWAKQRVEARAFAKTSDGYAHSGLVLAAVPGRRTDWIDALDRIQKELTILAFGPALILGRLALMLYAPFRSIPIAAIQNMAALKSADNFLTRWFGELPDIISDPIQSANVRARLAAAVRGLQAEGCGRVSIVAHSGGAIVGYTTLCDPVYATVGVDQLITLGEGLALAWRIEDAPAGLVPGSRLLGDLAKLRPNLHWADFWATYDPAPAGPIKPPQGAGVADRSYSTTNRMSILEDHGSYWDNDEEFLVPLLQHLDAPTGRPEESRFFRDGRLATVRLAWRRQRGAVLALWRWLATLGAGIPIAVATIRALLGAIGVGGLAPKPGPERLGADVAGAWGQIPGHEIIAGPLDGISRAASWPGVLPQIGEWMIGTIIVAVMFVVLARIGVGRWEAWDLRARVAARKRVPESVGTWSPRLTFLLLTVADVAMAAGAFWLFWR